MFRGVDHVAIASPDPEALAGWYVERLDFTVTERLGARVFLAGADGSMLEITLAAGPRIPRPHDSPGFRHLAIAVDDLDAACARLEGIRFFEPPQVRDGCRLAFFDDPDGNILHLIERDPKSRNAPGGGSVSRNC
jgi:glyoxylase I family protein